jgi:hypothetical protein
MRGTNGKVSSLTPSHPTEDLKNKWADSAFEKRYSVLEILCFFTVVFLLGFLASTSLMFSMKDSKVSEVEVEIVDPSYLTLVESTSEMIDYAAEKNGATILVNLSSPEFHGSFSVASYNNLQALISDHNGPEQCWPSVGSNGFATIQLAARVFPVGFSVVLPSTFYKTIPKRLSVFSVDSRRSLLLATIFVDVSENDQKMMRKVYVECMFNCQEPTQVVRLEVNENYGDVYTCVYQFQVHGLKTAK